MQYGSIPEKGRKAVTNRAKGLLLVVTATLIYASIGVFAKWTSASPLVLLCSWMVVGLPVFLISAFVRRVLVVSRRDLMYAGAVTMLLLVADAAFLTAVKLLPISTATFVKFLFPATIVLVAAPLIWRRRVAAVHLWSAGLGLAGLVVILRPWAGSAASGWGYGLALVSAACLAFAFTLFKKIDAMPRDTFLAYRYSIGSIVLVPIVGLTEPASALFAPAAFWPLIGFGLLYGVIASIIDTTSFVYLDERDIGIVKYIEPLAATFLAALFLSEAVSPTVFVGGLFIIASGLLIAMRKNDKKLEIVIAEKKSA